MRERISLRFYGFECNQQANIDDGSQNCVCSAAKPSCRRQFERFHNIHKWTQNSMHSDSHAEKGMDTDTYKIISISFDGINQNGHKKVFAIVNNVQCLPTSTKTHLHTHTLAERHENRTHTLRPKNVNPVEMCSLFIHIHSVGFLGKETVIFIYLPTEISTKFPKFLVLTTASPLMKMDAKAAIYFQI